MIVVRRFFYFISFLFCSFIFYGIVNGYGCKYELEINVEEDRVSFVKCYGGKLSMLHYGKNDNHELVTAWKVTGRQLNFGNQLLFFITDRKKIEGNLISNSTDRYNYLSSRNYLFFYYVVIDKDDVYVFDDFYANKLIKGKKRGSFDMEERLGW